MLSKLISIKNQCGNDKRLIFVFSTWMYIDVSEKVMKNGYLFVDFKRNWKM